MISARLLTQFATLCEREAALGEDIEHLTELADAAFHRAALLGAPVEPSRNWIFAPRWTVIRRGGGIRKSYGSFESRARAEQVAQRVIEKHMDAFVSVEPEE